MNWLDIVILVAIALSTLYGLWSGLVKTVFFLAGMIFGIILAGRYSDTVAGMLTFISDPSTARLVAFVAIVLVVELVATLLGSLVKWTMEKMMLGWLNHLGGAVLGFVIGAIVCGALLAIWGKTAGFGDVVANSAMAGILLERFPLALALLPPEFDSVRSFFK